MSIIPPVSKEEEPWNGWEKYPANLSRSICSPLVYDLEFISDQLSQDSSRLFITGDSIRIRVIEVGVKGKNLFSERRCARVNSVWRFVEFTIKSKTALEDYLLVWPQIIIRLKTRTCMVD